MLRTLLIHTTCLPIPSSQRTVDQSVPTMRSQDLSASVCCRGDSSRCQTPRGWGLTNRPSTQNTIPMTGREVAGDPGRWWSEGLLVQQGWVRTSADRLSRVTVMLNTFKNNSDEMGPRNIFKIISCFELGKFRFVAAWLVSHPPLTWQSFCKLLVISI